MDSNSLIIIKPKELSDIVHSAVDHALRRRLPEVIRQTETKPWLTTKEAQEYLGCSRRHLQHLRDSGQIPYTQHQRTIRYKTSELDAFLRAHHIEPTKRKD